MYKPQVGKATVWNYPGLHLYPDIHLLTVLKDSEQTSSLEFRHKWSKTSILLCRLPWKSSHVQAQNGQDWTSEGQDIFQQETHGLIKSKTRPVDSKSSSPLPSKSNLSNEEAFQSTRRILDICIYNILSQKYSNYLSEEWEPSSFLKPQTPPPAHPPPSTAKSPSGWDPSLTAASASAASAASTASVAAAASSATSWEISSPTWMKCQSQGF